MKLSLTTMASPTPELIKYLSNVRQEKVETQRTPGSNVQKALWTHVAKLQLPEGLSTSSWDYDLHVVQEGVTCPSKSQPPDALFRTVL